MTGKAPSTVSPTVFFGLCQMVIVVDLGQEFVLQLSFETKGHSQQDYLRISCRRSLRSGAMGAQTFRGYIPKPSLGLNCPCLPWPCILSAGSMVL